MAEKLRRKFIIIAISSVSIVLFVIVFSMNLSSFLQVVGNADELLLILTENGGRFPRGGGGHKNGYNLPPKMSPETPFSTRFFTVKLNSDKSPLEVDTGKISAASTEEAAKYAQSVLTYGRTSGFYKEYKYLVSNEDYGYLVIFVDCGKDLQMFYSFLRNSIVICIVGLSAVFMLVVIFSKKAIAPVAESYERQKQFITDASHELKTPLAIINANTEVLEIESGENEWTGSIKNQVKRLGELVGSLVSLTRMDEENSQLVKAEFSLSDAVYDVSGPFLKLAEANGQELHMDIQNGVTYLGDEVSIRQLVSILLDNAIKYSLKPYPITLCLTQRGKKCIISTLNRADGLTKGGYDIFFQRFYRPDSSRNRYTGGYGIGLSIAMAIVKKHRGSISAKSPDGETLIITAAL